MEELDLQQQSNFKLLKKDINQINLMVSNLTKMVETAAKQEIKKSIGGVLQNKMGGLGLKLK